MATAIKDITVSGSSSTVTDTTNTASSYVSPSVKPTAITASNGTTSGIIPYYDHNADTAKNQYTNMDDNNFSDQNMNRVINPYMVENINSLEQWNGLFHSAGLFKDNEIDLFNKRYRYGILMPTKALTTTREFLFITKPDLNIYPRGNDNGGIPSNELNTMLQSSNFWLDLAENNLDIIRALQYSLPAVNGGAYKDPFNHLLENTVQSNLDTPSMSAEMVETPSNMYGVNYTYRGSSEASDDGFDFSLEFKDTKYLQVYKFFKAYEDYETRKHHGLLEPWHQYIIDKILYDQYCIYKFLVGEDGETIVYWCKYFGVTSKSLPREVFSNTSFDAGLSYSVDFHAAFFDDMKPEILYDFNYLSKNFYESRNYQVNVYNRIMDRPDNRPVKAAYVIQEYSTYAPGNKVYKLKWRGDDES